MGESTARGGVTIQRDDLKRCPFCGTSAIQKVINMGIPEDTEAGKRYLIGCGNPFCNLDCRTKPAASLTYVEGIWQDRE